MVSSSRNQKTAVTPMGYGGFFFGYLLRRRSYPYCISKSPGDEWRRMAYGAMGWLVGGEAASGRPASRSQTGPLRDKVNLRFHIGVRTLALSAVLGAIRHLLV